MCKKYCFIPLFHTGPESCNRMGGGGGGLCPSCKIQRWDYVLVVKFTGGGGDYVLVVKFMGGGILSTYTKMSRGGVVRGGLCPYPPFRRIV